MRGALSSFTQYVFMAWSLVKHKDNFALPLPVGWKVAEIVLNVDFGAIVYKFLVLPVHNIYSFCPSKIIYIYIYIYFLF
jgi:hypothetical protein